MSEELKPCPFCGETRIFLDKRTGYNFHSEYLAYCISCHSEGPKCDTEDVARTMWNSRPTQKGGDHE